VVQAKSASMVS